MEQRNIGLFGVVFKLISKGLYDSFSIFKSWMHRWKSLGGRNLEVFSLWKEKIFQIFFQVLFQFLSPCGFSFTNQCEVDRYFRTNAVQTTEIIHFFIWLIFCLISSGQDEDSGAGSGERLSSWLGEKQRGTDSPLLTARWSPTVQGTRVSPGVLFKGVNIGTGRCGMEEQSSLQVEPAHAHCDLRAVPDHALRYI